MLLHIIRAISIVLKGGKKWEEMGSVPGYRVRKAIPGKSESPCLEGLQKYHSTPRGAWQYQPGIGSGCLLVVRVS